MRCAQSGALVPHTSGTRVSCRGCGRVVRLRYIPGRGWIYPTHNRPTKAARERAEARVRRELEESLEGARAMRKAYKDVFGE